MSTLDRRVAALEVVAGLEPRCPECGAPIDLGASFLASPRWWAIRGAIVEVLEEHPDYPELRVKIAERLMALESRDTTRRNGQRCC